MKKLKNKSSLFYIASFFFYIASTIISHRNCIFNDEYTNDYSILSGESGTILTLINGIYLSKEYPKLLMID